MAVDTYDILLPAEARRAVKHPEASTSIDAKLEPWVTAVSRRIDDLCGPVVQRTVTDELHENLSGYLFLRETPVVSITNVKEWSSGTATVLTAETAATSGDYRYDSRLGTITRRSSWYDTSWSSSYVTVTYVAGRYASTAVVDPLFKQAAALMLQHLWSSQGMERGLLAAEDGSLPFGVPSFAVPRQVSDLLGSEVRMPAIA